MLILEQHLKGVDAEAIDPPLQPEAQDLIHLLTDFGVNSVGPDQYVPGRGLPIRQANCGVACILFEADAAIARTDRIWIGLVSQCTPDDELMPTALQIAEDLATGPRRAIAATKRTLNHWVRAASPIFESSLALEMLGFFSEDAREGLDAMREKRRPKFPSSLGTET